MPIINDEESGSYAQLAYLIDQQRQQKTQVAFIFGGESLGPSLLSSMDKGSHIIDLLNSLSPSAMGVSKREFSYQEDELTIRSYEAAFPIVSSNLYDPLTQEPYLEGTQPSVILSQGAVTLGFMSILDPSVAKKYPTDRIKIQKVENAIRNQASLLRKQNADLIVLHYSTYKPLINQLLQEGVIDIGLLKDQNFHLSPHYEDKKHPRNFIIQQKNQALVLDLKLGDQPADNKIQVTATSVDLTQLPPDPKVFRQEQEYDDRLNAFLSRKVGITKNPIDLTRQKVRTAENGFTNYVADVLKQYTEADISLINSGTFRGNVVYPAGSQLSIKDIRNMMPYRNRPVLVEATGQQILDAIEHGLTGLENVSGQFLQVSGLEIHYRSSRPAGQRLITTRFNGRPIDPTLTYKVATLDYLLEGGDGFNMFRTNRLLDYKKPASLILADVILEHIEKEKIIAPKVDGRLQDLP
ncbi:5'-nucleotidase C-terminal domain-containing protein [Marinomonas sp. THO17]|uniref:bifunctional metallophosphatase/5'-nucleotidase n=1 Tax=Marinomonas sp. THO17 TaxID=3149048 RepID=UPI00336C0007